MREVLKKGLREKIERLEVVRRDEVKARQPLAFKYRSALQVVFVLIPSSISFCLCCHEWVESVVVVMVVGGRLCGTCHPSTLTAASC
ncbi:unnamed protein product [Brugia pahangi]|uniref:Uncharacterized protein n=1 Tax=Brugia pahangi TaxID=6280 RepID=A0A0N4TJX7_BRUPA|nr:unnamed protein product [Brugia pahangi]